MDDVLRAAREITTNTGRGLMRNRQRFAIGVVVTGICLVLAGCGGSSGVTQDEYDALQAELDAAEQDLMEEQAARQQAEADEQAAEAARRQAEADEQAAEAARQQAEAEAAAAAAAAEAAEEAKQKAEAADVNARAGVFIGELDDGTRRSASVTWERGKSKMVDPSGGVFTKGSAAPSIPGFSGNSFTRSVGTATSPVEQTAYIYTNIQSPGTKAFWKKHGLSVESGSWTATLAKPASFGNNRSLYQDSGGSPANEDEGSRGGTYDGASGTFTCAETGNCNIAADADGALTYTGVWTFRPSSPTSGVTLNQDEEFLYFGIWQSIPGIASGTYGFEVIHGGNPTNYTAAADVLTGRATFRGGAIGKYVTRNQVGQNARIGTFTADAEFSANFDTPDLAGTIKNFREGDSTLSGWLVTLGATGNAANPAGISSGAVSGDVAASIGGVSATGVWAATLYASDNQTLADRTTYPLTQYPEADLAGVAGHFEASSAADAANSDVAIAGAFAATPSR